MSETERERYIEKVRESLGKERKSERERERLTKLPYPLYCTPLNIGIPFKSKLFNFAVQTANPAPSIFSPRPPPQQPSFLQQLQHQFLPGPQQEEGRRKIIRLWIC